ncbi:hypothetical protein Mgra_00001747 [Meloidogyne graminicola]|uniref:RRM domain-containing protein n=1 Tax=Meloidogyne graminicola TaxID=189291 RepID=A0A8S9ZZU9_9BILA|nr:hypothetical protein Mgra_00001747 [Meloidogyne graminicola]
MVDVEDVKPDIYQNGNGSTPVTSNVGGSGGSVAGGGTKNTAQLEPEQFRKLFIGGLSLNTTDETLHNFYSQYGELVDCIVMRDSATKRSRGFGFVSYSCQAEVDQAMLARPHTIDGKVVDPKRAVPRDQSQKSEQNMSTKRLYVSGVREEHTEEMFSKYFAQFGVVTKVEIINDKVTQKTRGFAFISFDDYDSVDRCVLLKSHMIYGYRCDVKKALSRDEMQKAAQKERDRMERGTRSRDSGGRGSQSYGGRGGGGYGGGGYGGQYGGGYPPPAWGPPAGPPQWGGGGYVGSYGGGGYAASYGQGPAPWGAPTGPQAAEQGQWAASGGGGYVAAGGLFII